LVVRLLQEIISQLECDGPAAVWWPGARFMEEQGRRPSQPGWPN